TSGSGTFASATVLNPVYTPSTADITAGSVTLTLTATSASPCVNSTDAMVLNIKRQAIVSAGTDATICETGTYELSTPTAVYTTSLTWTTSGTGTFSNFETLHPVYTPSAADITAGTVTLTLTGTSASPCVNSTDAMVLTIHGQPIADAGIDATICQGTSYTVITASASSYTSLLWTATGAGELTGETTLSPTYTPTALQTGTVTMTLTASAASGCTAAVSTMTITINGSATASAGSDATICETAASYTLTGSATNYASYLWTTNGTGVFSNTSTTLTPVYTPSTADITSGSVILTLNVTGNTPCSNTSDAMTLTIKRQAIVSAGTDATICETAGTYTISAATAQHAVTYLWTTSGSGTFASATVLNPVYTPSTADITAGSVTLTLTATSASPCVSSTDAMVLNIKRQAIVSAGTDATICETGTYTLSTPTAVYTNSLTWTTSGTGTFSNFETLHPVYTPGAADITAGTVTLTLTGTSASPCINSTDAMTLIIHRQPIVYAGSDVTICAMTAPYYTLTGSTSMYQVSLLWTSSGTGTFTDATALHPNYMPSLADINAGAVTLTITASAAPGCINAVSSMVLTIKTSPTANIGVASATICETMDYSLSLATVTNSSSLLWTTSGTGTFNNPEAIHPVYTPGEADINAGSVILTLTSYGNLPCGNVTSSMTLNINKAPIANAGSNVTVCQATAHTISGATASNYQTIHWTENGPGSLSNASTLTPTYTPLTGETGVVVLTLTASPKTGCLVASVSTMTITINGSATASAGPDATICETTASYTLAGTATNYSSYLWTTSGTGTFSNTPTTLTPVYTPSLADITAGTVILTLNVTGFSPCSNTSDAMTLTIKRQAVADAGADATICETAGTYTIAGATARHAVTYLWTTSGSGTFADATVLNPVYTPGAADITSGAVTLTLTATSASPCASSTDAMVLNIKRQAIVSAGTDATICQAGSYMLSTSTSIYTLNVAWTTSGTGTFSNFETLHPVYTPSAADITAGTVTLTLTGTSASPCANSTDAMVLSITPQSTGDAGPDATICETAGTYTISGSTASNAGSYSWVTSGTGTFVSSTILHPVYTPSSADISAGSVTLTLTATSPSPCVSATDAMILNISRQAIVDAGINSTICETGTYTLSTSTSSYTSSVTWTTNGTGTFSNFEELHPVYTPSAADISAGTVILTLTGNSASPCINATDKMTLTIHRQALADAGVDATVCQGSTYTVSTATAINYTSLAWTENGTGSLSASSTLTPIYTPGSGETGVVTLTLTAVAASGCSNAVSTMTITINGSATASAGVDATICETAGSYTLSGTATNYASYLWTTSGTGTFSNTPTTLTPVYTPSAADITAGSVILTLNVTGNTSCSNTSDAMVLTITPQSTVDAGSDATICETAGTYTISGASAQYAAGYLWTTSGTGTFADETVLNPVYTPGAADITIGAVTLTLTATSASPCVSSTDAMVLNIKRQAIVSAGTDATICQAGSYTLSTSTSIYTSSVTWTTSGTGTFSNFEILHPVYTPGAADITAGTVTLTLTGTSANPCVNSSDVMVLSITPQSTADAGADATICETAGTYTISGATAQYATGYLWTTSGTGSFTNAMDLNPTYTPGAEDIAAGNVLLTLVAGSASPCAGSSDAMVLNIKRQAIVSAGTDATICETGTYALSTPTAVYTTGLTWSTSGTGTFSNFETLHPIYTPGAADITAGTVTLTLTGTSASPCVNSSDAMVLSIVPIPLANAGQDATICETSTSFICNATASNYTSFYWETTGTGLFSNNYILNPVYIPSQADVNAGCISLVLHLMGNSPCEEVTDTMKLCISRIPVANAGPDDMICKGTEYVLSGTSAMYYGNIIWTTSGTGAFNNCNILHPVYTPSVGDINSGSVILTMSLIANSPCQNSSDAMVLNFYPNPVATAYLVSNVKCNGFSDGILSVSVTNGTPAYSYLWSDGQTTATAVGLAAGTYTVTVTDAHGCKETAVATVGINPLPVLVITNPAAVCAPNTVNISDPSITSGSILYGGVLSYWMDAGATIPMITYTAAGMGVYYIKATTFPGCYDIKPVTVTVNPLPIAAAGSNRGICMNQTTQLGDAPVQGNIYIWTSVPAGFNSTTANPYVTPLTTTTYTLTETVTATGCTNTHSVVVTVNPLPLATAGADRTICLSDGTTIGAAAVAGNTYSWTSIPAGFISTVANPAVYPQTATFYYLTETVTATGCTNSHSVHVLVNPKPVLVITNPAAVCSPNKVNLSDPSVTAGSTLEGGLLTYWMDAGALIPMINYTAASAGTYYIKATTASGCYDIKPVKATVNPLPSLFVGTGSGYYCPGGPGLILGISGSQTGVNYTLWKGVVCMSSIIPGTGGPIFFGPQTAIGSYYVIAENVTTHCINTMDNCVEIILQAQLPVSVSVVPSANPVSTGTAVTFTATPVNGGSSPLYQWKVNGYNVGSNAASNIYTYNPANGDIVTCVLTSNASCVSGNPASSNAVTMDVTGVPVAVTITGEVLNGQTNCYNATQTLTIAGNGTSFTVNNGGSATMIAGQNIRYLPGTSVHAGGYMRGYITTNNQYCGQAPSMVTVIAGEGENPIIPEQTFFTIYPNPTSGNFTLEQKGGIAYEIVKVEVYGMRGERLINQELIGEKKHEFWFSDLPPGLYIVKVFANEHMETFKLVKTR
ncbi:MAG: T9SS type A sorting domain-containing protein, partial [Bacteroidales bacterium]